MLSQSQAVCLFEAEPGKDCCNFEVFIIELFSQKEPGDKASQLGPLFFFFF